MVAVLTPGTGGTGLEEQAVACRPAPWWEGTFPGRVHFLRLEGV